MASTPDGERALLACVLELYASGDAQARRAWLPTTLPGAMPFSSPTADVLLETLLAHFQTSQRHAQAVEYFTTLREWCADAAAPAAAAMAALGLREDALRTLTSALEAAPQSELLLHALTDLYLSSGEQSATAALVTARRAVRAFPSGARGYLLLARAYVGVGNFPLALATLNVAPSPPLSPPSASQAAFVTVAPIAAQRTFPRAYPHPLG